MVFKRILSQQGIASVKERNVQDYLLACTWRWQRQRGKYHPVGLRRSEPPKMAIGIGGMND